MTALSQTREPAREITNPSAGGPLLQFTCERPQDRADVDALIDRAFGPGRFAKTAERLREGGRAHLDMSVCAWMDGRLAGAVRLWPAGLGGVPVVFLGPIAVEKALRDHGLGAELVRQACARARTAGEKLVILVGDLGFFGPLGFEAVPPGHVAPPGPVDPRRLLWTALLPDALDGLGGALKVAPEA